MRLSALLSTGLPRPSDYVPPPPPELADIARSLAVIGTDILPTLARLALSRHLPSTGAEAGLAAIRDTYLETLRRLGVDLTVLHAERVPREGGLILMWNQESHLDHLVLPVAIPRPFLSLYNNEIANIPFYGERMRRGIRSAWRPPRRRLRLARAGGDCSASGQ